LFCDRCLKQLHPGRGDYFEVRIEAVADPTPPDIDIDLEKSPETLHREYEALLAQLRDLSPAEARDQVYRHVWLTLCNTCFNSWIEDPAGKSSSR
jgi:hypothetical protein